MRPTEEYLEDFLLNKLKPAMLAKNPVKAMSLLEEAFASGRIRTHLEDYWDLYLSSIEELDPHHSKTAKGQKMDNVLYDLEMLHNIEKVSDLLSSSAEKLLSLKRKGKPILGKRELKTFEKALAPLVPLWDMPPDCFAALTGIGIYTHNQLAAKGQNWIRKTFVNNLRGKIMRVLQDRKAKEAAPKRR